MATLQPQTEGLPPETHPPQQQTEKPPATELEQLNRLAAKANEHHKEVEQAWRGALEHAKHAGDALRQAKKIVGCGGKWGAWLAVHFKGSERLARQYMQVSKLWHHPRLKAARDNGMEFRSIQSLLELFAPEDRQPQAPPPQPVECELTEEEADAERLRYVDAARAWLVGELAKKVESIPEQELLVLGFTVGYEGGYSVPRIFYSLWTRLQERLTELTQQYYEGDYEDPDDWDLEWRGDGAPDWHRRRQEKIRTFLDPKAREERKQRWLRQRAAERSRTPPTLEELCPWLRAELADATGQEVALANAADKQRLPANDSV